MSNIMSWSSCQISHTFLWCFTVWSNIQRFTVDLNRNIMWPFKFLQHLKITVLQNQRLWVYMTHHLSNTYFFMKAFGRFPYSTYHKLLKCWLFFHLYDLLETSVFVSYYVFIFLHWFCLIQINGTRQYNRDEANIRTYHFTYQDIL